MENLNLELLEKVSVTTNRTGYPEHVYECIVANSVTELNELQTKYGGNIVMLYKKYGQSLWVNNGIYNGLSLLDLHQNVSDTVISYIAGQDAEKVARYYVYNRETAYDYIVGNCEGLTAVEIAEIINANEALIEDITDNIRAEKGDTCNVWLNNPNYDSVDFVVTAECVEFSQDSTVYRLALQLD